MRTKQTKTRTTTTRTDGRKYFTAIEFDHIMRAHAFTGACIFWRRLERDTSPGWRLSNHALAILRELGQQVLDDCDGRVFSPQQRDCLEYLGLGPVGVRGPGECAHEERVQRA
jgi:hypothetical protein